MTSDFITTVLGLCNFCCKSDRDAAVGAEDGVIRGGAKDEVEDVVDVDSVGGQVCLFLFDALRFFQDAQSV